jgi:hypothetical protein
MPASRRPISDHQNTPAEVVSTPTQAEADVYKLRAHGVLTVMTAWDNGATTWDDRATVWDS